MTMIQTLGHTIGLDKPTIIALDALRKQRNVADYRKQDGGRYKGTRMSAYIIFNYKILDRVQIEKLRGLLTPILEKYETEVIVASPVKTIEGDAYPNMVIHRFNSIEDAERFYYSKEHQEIAAFRQSITEGWATIVPGYVEEVDVE